MALTEYVKKRDFKATPEPKGKTVKKSPAKKKERLMFVVQEHHASHLHYDFRLEWDGFLKSWAIPKGPSLDPHAKRLAVEVEDHPVEYGKFEGVIPPNQYGSGRVYIWDTGTWSPLSDVEEGLQRGRLDFEMKGQKLKGKWSLFRTKQKSSSKPQWILMKRTDEFAVVGHEADQIEKPQKSAKSTILKNPAKGGIQISELKLTNPDKILYPQEKITKLDVAQYYIRHAEFILPFLKNRPLTLVRCPEGTQKICFFQKHISDSTPEFVDPVEIREKTKKNTYMSVDDIKGLASLVQMGAFEIHCWNSTKSNLENPDQIVMDFDPSPQLPWKKVVAAAYDLKNILDALGLVSFVKLSGGKGLHVHIPFKPLYSWDQIKNFSKALALQLEKNNPKLYLTKASKSEREGKIFIDYLRNTRGATAVAPYSLRAKEKSSVALPLSWKEIKEIKGPKVFSLKETIKHLEKRKIDPWADYFHELQELPHLKPKG